MTAAAVEPAGELASLSSVHTLVTASGKPLGERRNPNAVLAAAIAEDGQFGRPNYSKRYSNRLARLANRAGLGSRAANFQKCSRTLALDSVTGKIIARDACNQRDCPFCQGRRSARWACRLKVAIPEMHDSEARAYRWILLTPTVRSVPISELRAELRHIHRSLDRMTKRKQFAPVGWFRHTEVTYNRATGMCHPHIHLLGAVLPEYFERPWRKVKRCGDCGLESEVKHIVKKQCPACGARAFNGRPRIEPGYMQQWEWVSLWEDCARIDYTRENGERVGAVLDIRAIPGDLTSAQARGALYEITKYAQKPADLINLTPKQYAETVEQNRGVRSIGVSGTLSKFLKEPKVFRDGEWKREPAPAIEETGPVASWNDDAKRYLVDGSPLAHQWRRAVAAMRLVPLEHRQTYAGNPFDVSATEGEILGRAVLMRLAAQCGWTHSDKYGTLPP